MAAKAAIHAFISNAVSLPATPFWFLRHGETDYNARGLSQGALDISLNATGRTQAAIAGPILQNRGIVAIVSSPMLRTRETAAIVNESLNLPISYEPDLREVIFGGMEGKPLTPWFHDWMAGTYTPEGAESFAALTSRVEAVMHKILRNSGPLLIVAHGGVFRAIRAIFGLTADGLTPNAQPLYCDRAEENWRITAAE